MTKKLKEKYEAIFYEGKAPRWDELFFIWTLTMSLVCGIVFPQIIGQLGVTLWHYLIPVLIWTIAPIAKVIHSIILRFKYKEET